MAGSNNIIGLYGGCKRGLRYGGICNTSQLRCTSLQALAALVCLIAHHILGLIKLGACSIGLFFLRQFLDYASKVHHFFSLDLFRWKFVLIA